MGPQGPIGVTGPAGATGATGPGTLNGTLNFVVKFTPNGTSGGNSLIFDNGTDVGIGTVTPGFPLEVDSAVAASATIVGTNSSASSWGIFGLNDAAGGAGQGVGVFGITTQSAGAGTFGANNSNTGTGAIGLGNDLTVYSLAATGSGGAFTGTTVGAYGVGSTVASGTGVVGVGNNVAAYGLLAGGSGGAFTGRTTGVYGLGSTAASGTGVVGVGNNVAAGAVLAAGSGGAFTGTTTGVYGFASRAASGTGVVGVGNNVATASVLAGGSGGAFTGTTTGLYAVSTTASTTASSQAIQTVNTASGGAANATVNVNAWDATDPAMIFQYKIIGNGMVSTLVADPTDPTGTRELTLHAPETPEAYFEDYGEAQLVGGFVHVELDPVFAASVAVDARHPLRVFVQLEENEGTFGVVVKNKTPTGFDVVEIAGGSGDMPFQWHVVGNRANVTLRDGRVVRYADARFEVFHGRGEAVQLPAQQAPSVAVPALTQQLTTASR